MRLVKGLSNMMLPKEDVDSDEENQSGSNGKQTAPTTGENERTRSNASIDLLFDNGETDHDDKRASQQTIHDNDSDATGSIAIEEEGDPVLAKREQRAVFGLRLIAFTVLVLSMIGTALAVYYYHSNNEQSKFESQFQADASKILSSIGTSFQMTMSAIDFFVVTMVSHTRVTNQQWPLITIPDFALRAEKLLRMTNVYFVDLYPVVTAAERAAFENHTARDGLAYLNETNEFMIRSNAWKPGEHFAENISETRVANYLFQHQFNEDRSYAGIGEIPRNHSGPFLPRWQTHTPHNPYPYNWDFMTSGYSHPMRAVMDTHQAVLGETRVENDITHYSLEPNEPPRAGVSSSIIYPILEESVDYMFLRAQTPKVNEEGHYDPLQHNLQGILSGFILWSDWMESILPVGSNGIRVVFEAESCNHLFTYQINGPDVEFLGGGDHHESRYDHLGIEVELLELYKYTSRQRADFRYTGATINDNYCPFTLRVYPSSLMETSFQTKQPAVMTGVTVLIFVFVSIVFVAYDCCVERRQRIVTHTALRNHAVVSNLFPKNVREQLLRSVSQNRKLATQNKGLSSLESIEAPPADSLPIAELYPEATVLFGDLAGFTSWSSSREPSQVFVLLETLYGAFDKIAKLRKVFKIETIGDCYVAVTGLPVASKRHAVNMSRFASDIIQAMNFLTQDLELRLGPGTADLRLRIGLHTGAVTAGVLRGEKARFQLFGDTVNTAARMESNGKPNRIHCSQKTAENLLSHGKHDWVSMRPDLIEAKGKGKMQTYWIDPDRVRAKDQRPSMGFDTTETTTPDWKDCSFTEMGSVFDNLRIKLKTMDSHGSSEASPATSKIDKLIDWNMTLLEEPLKRLIAHRAVLDGGDAQNGQRAAVACNSPKNGKTPRDEVVESIPGLTCSNPVPGSFDLATISLPTDFVTQLRNYISSIAQSYYGGNAFHNFERATNVTTSTKSLLQQFNARVGILAGMPVTGEGSSSFSPHLQLDPLAQVAILIATIVADTGHQGITNAQLVSEEAEVASRYKFLSVSEQTSIDIAWKTLMQPLFSDLRAFLFPNEKDLHMFRQVMVNCVIATDLYDTDLNNMREQRWQDAFAVENDTPAAANELNRKATAIVECIVQSSNICHCMQHWTLYQKWSGLLFDEMYAPFVEGRIDADPALAWYDSHIYFFDHVVVPLAQKLKACKALGASGHEFFDFAADNRLEWECRGQDMVEELKEAFWKRRSSSGGGTTSEESVPGDLRSMNDGR